MLNILIKLRLNRRSLQIIDLQVSMAQLPGRTNVRLPWALAHGNQNISCFDSGIVSKQREPKGLMYGPSRLPGRAPILFYGLSSLNSRMKIAAISALAALS